MFFKKSKYIFLLSVVSFLLLVAGFSTASAAVEDYTTYTEVDAGGYITVDSSTQITVNGDADFDAYVYKDKGAGYFSGDFTHYFDFRNTGTGNGRWNPWVLAGSLDDARALNNTWSDGYYVDLRYNGGIAQCRLGSFYNGNRVNCAQTLTQNTTYYASISRTGTTLTLNIYTNAARTTLLFSNSITVGAETPRYVYAVNNENRGQTGRTYAGVVYNLDLRESAAYPGARVVQQITIDGQYFGSSCSSPNFVVKIGTYEIPCANVSGWTPTQIILTIPSAITTYGGVGAAGLIVRGGGVDDPTPLTFYVYPDITSLTTPIVTNAAREYDAGDTDGVITINGNRFGGAPGGTVTILGQPATVNSWVDWQIEVQIPTSIADNVYTGNIVVTRSWDSKDDTWTSFRILPRITSLVPSSGSISDAVAVNGNHLCQSGSCPLAGSRSTASDNITFYNGVLVPDGDVSGWTDTLINVLVPAGSQTGNVFVTSNSYLSNTKSFNVSGVVPNDPTGLGQYKLDSVTVISVGSGTNENSVIFKMTMVAGQNMSLVPQVEVKDIDTAFDATGIVDGSPVAFTGSPVIGEVTVPGLVNGTSYYWRARVKNNDTGTDYSGWVSFGGNSDGSPPSTPADVDFFVDTVTPIISGVCAVSVSASNCAGDPPDDISANIIWQTDENSTSQVEYGELSCVSGTLEPVSPSDSVTNHIIALNNLNVNTLYYYRVRSVDGAGNEAIYPTSGCNSFTTQDTMIREMKTTENYITTLTGQLGIGSDANQTFSLPIYDPGFVINSVFVEISGITQPAAPQNIQVWVNSQTSKTYAVTLTDESYFTILHQVLPADLNIATQANPGLTNVFHLIPQVAAISVVSAKIITTYNFTP